MAAKSPPVSRAAMPEGRHAKTGPNAPAQGRHAKPGPAKGPTGSTRAAAAQARSRRAAQASWRASGKAAATGRKGIARGGQHALMAEFLLFCGIVGLRAVGEYVPQEEGASKGTVTPKPGQLGPLPILAAGFALFFVLSFLAARGGTWARVSAIFGLLVDLVLLMRSLPELSTVSQAFPDAVKNGTAPENNAATGPGNAGSAPTPTGA